MSNIDICVMKLCYFGKLWAILLPLGHTVVAQILEKYFTSTAFLSHLKVYDIFSMMISFIWGKMFFKNLSLCYLPLLFRLQQLDVRIIEHVDMFCMYTK